MAEWTQVGRGAHDAREPRGAPARWNRRKRVRTSYGVILVARVGGAPAALLGRRRYSYAFADFVHNNSRPRDDAGLLQLLSAMTVEEKLDIRTGDFRRMFSRIWLGEKEDTKFYEWRRDAFEEDFVRKGGVRRLTRLVDAAASRPLTWEPPKGHLEGHESDLAGAFRELEEEGAIPARSVRYVPGFRAERAHTSGGQRYRAAYFLAVADRPAAPRVHVGRVKQVSELGELRWVTLAEARLMDGRQPATPVSQLLAAAFSYAKRRGEIPVSSLNAAH